MSQQCTFIGNLAADPELRFSRAGSAVAAFSVLCSERYRDKSGEWQDGDTFPVWGTAFGDFAERICASVSRGDRVVVTGKYRRREYEKEDGSKGYSTDFIADEFAVSCRFAEVRSQRVRGSRRGPQGSANGSAVATEGEDPWAAGERSGELVGASAGAAAGSSESAPF